MKKLFYALSISLICSLGASAATPQRLQVGQLINLKELSSVSTGSVKKAVKINPDGTTGQKRTKKKVSVSDYYGDWLWESSNELNVNNFPYEGAMTIEPIENSDSILIKGFDIIADEFRGGLKGIFKNDRIYIPNQITSYYTEMDDGPWEATKFFNISGRTPNEKEIEEITQLYPGEDPNSFLITIKAPDANPFFLALDDEGDLVSVLYPEDFDGVFTDALYLTCFSVAADGPAAEEEGIYWAAFYVVGSPIEKFEFYPEEWTLIGNSQFVDAWTGYTQDGPYPVPTYRNVLDSNRFLLFDPYGPDSPYGQEGINADDTLEGYLMFDISDPECVLFLPFVYSLSMNIGNDGVQKLYNYNWEGYYHYIGNQSVDKIIQIFDQEDKITSYLDTKSGTVYVFNACFDVLPQSTFAYPLNWDGAPMDGTILLPEGYNDNTAVDTVLGEDENAPVVYYNLQGVKVANPEKGQLVIVSKGNKATKQIIR